LPLRVLPLRIARPSAFLDRTIVRIPDKRLARRIDS
jgi:hypothetical protein